MPSSYQHIGLALRSLRVAKAMSQQALAGAAGISRTTLIQIEKGNDAQLSSVEMAAHVREKHLKIAVKLALGGALAISLKENALRMVDLWQEKALCSPIYIDRWRQILNAEPPQIAQGILAMDEEWGPALRQNTPFATAMP